jgi:hypothetical protein
MIEERFFTFSQEPLDRQFPPRILGRQVLKLRNETLSYFAVRICEL